MGQSSAAEKYYCKENIMFEEPLDLFNNILSGEATFLSFGIRCNILSVIMIHRHLIVTKRVDCPGKRLKKCVDCSGKLWDHHRNFENQNQKSWNRVFVYEFVKLLVGESMNNLFKINHSHKIVNFIKFMVLFHFKVPNGFPCNLFFPKFVHLWLPRA